MAIRSYPVARSIEMANEGLADAEALRGPGMERDYPDLVEVPEPIVHLEYRVFTLTDPDLSVGWNGLSGKRVCINLGEKVIENRTRGLAREEAHGVDAAFRMLRAGRCEAVIANQFAWATIDRLDLGHFCAGPAIIESVPLYHYVHRRHAGLVPRLTQALRHLRDDGTIQRTLEPELSRLAEARAQHECAATGTDLKDAARP
jgi:polar amino acid transport system substrate-binding protein